MASARKLATVQFVMLEGTRSSPVKVDLQAGMASGAGGSALHVVSQSMRKPEELPASAAVLQQQEGHVWWQAAGSQQARRLAGDSLKLQVSALSGGGDHGQTSKAVLLHSHTHTRTPSMMSRHSLFASICRIKALCAVLTEKRQPQQQRRRHQRRRRQQQRRRRQQGQHQQQLQHQ